MKPITEYELKIFELLREQKINEAFITMACHKSKQEYQGLGTNWEEWSKAGLEDYQILIYKDVYKKTITLSPTFHMFEDDIKVMCIMACMFSSNFYVPFLFQRLGAYIGLDCKITQDLKKELYIMERRVCDVLSKRLDIALYKNIGCQSYQIVACNDGKSCEICNSMNKRQFKVEDVEISLNCPPFHDLCRCTICPKS